MAVEAEDTHYAVRVDGTDTLILRKLDGTEGEVRVTAADLAQQWTRDGLLKLVQTDARFRQEPGGKWR